MSTQHAVIFGVGFNTVLAFRYLQEIGYTDTIIDVRSNRVRSLLGLNNNAEAEENLNNAQPVSTTLNGNEPAKTGKKSQVLEHVC